MPNTNQAVNRFLRDQLTERVETKAVTICEALKSDAGFDFKGTNLTFSDVMNDSDTIDGTLLMCVNTGDYDGLHDDIEEIVYTYAECLAKVLVSEGEL